MIKFICYPKCTTCQKAKKWLDDNKIEYELENVTVTDAEIIIQFNEEEHNFARLSESIAENEVGVQYQYRLETFE